MGVQPGVRQIGKYTVLDVIGTGGMGIVYRAHDPAIGRTVAIKMLRQADASGGIFDRFFSREMKSTGNLHHRNIVTVYDSGEQDGNPYLVMEFLEGEPTSKLIAERRQLPLVEKLDLVIQVCDGLQYAHDRNVIHRDIKPANVILLGDGTAKIVDFGVARIAGGESSIVQTGQLVGSLSYMSPEQINSIPIDARSDVFSTGVMLFELLTYELPFKGNDAASTFVKILREEPTPLSHFSQDFPPGLQPVIAKALAKNLNDRYQTAEEFGFDLLSVQKELKAATIADCMKRAETAMHRGDLDRVRVHLQEVIRLDRQNERANRLLREIRRAIQQQQRTSQVIQMRSQAQVALAGAQYEEALACADQALRLDPTDTESIQLCEEIRNAISRVKAVREALNRAESALFAGDFDEAKEAVEESMRLDPTDSEARAMASVINKELAERSRRQRVQTFVDQARREIAERKFSDALDALHQAEELDPSDSNVHELLQWALRGQEQEKRRRFLQEITDQIEKALHAGDFSSACTISEMGLSRFPDEPTLVRLRSISEKQRDIAERRKFVNDQSLAVKALVDQGRLEEAVQALTEALNRYPGEPNLESQLANTRAEIERQEFEREQAELQQALQRAEAEARARLMQQVLNWTVELRRSLDARTDLDEMVKGGAQLRTALEGKQIDEHAKEVAALVLNEIDARVRARDQAMVELEQLRRVVDRPNDTTALSEAENRLMSINAAFPHERELQQRSVELTAALTRLREQRDRALGSLSALARDLERTPTSELTSLFRRAREVATGFAGDAQIGALLQQIESSVTRRLERHSELLREISGLSTELAGAHSLEELTRTAERGKSIAALDPGDRELAERARQLENDAARVRGILESLLREMQALGQSVGSAATVQEAEGMVPRVKALIDKRPNFQELQEAAKRILTGIQGRRIEHDLIVQELESVRTSLPVLESDEELESAISRAAQCVESHPGDSSVRSLALEIDREVKQILRERAEFRARTLECDNALRIAEERMQAQDWEGVLEVLQAVEAKNLDRTDLRLQITVARKALEQQRAEQERIESERITRERAEAEARARQAAIEQAIQAGRRLLSEERGEEALQPLRDALKRYPGEASLQSALDATQAELTRRRAERELLERQRQERERIAREKAEAEARARRAAAEEAIGEASQLLVKGRGEEAVQRLRAALVRDPGNPDVQSALAATQGEIARRRAEAERERERLERVAKEKAEAEARARRSAAEQALNEARKLLAQGRGDAAIDVVRSAFDKDPGNQELGNALRTVDAEVARIRVERERAERERLERDRMEQERAERERIAREHAEAEMRVRKAAAEQAIAQARSMHNEGRSDHAAQVLRAALERDPQSQELKATLETIQIEVARRREEQERQERERVERERAAREKAEAELRARKQAAEVAIKESRDLLARKRGDEAVQRLRGALERDPENQELQSAAASTQAEVARQRAEQERQEKERQERERLAREQAEAEARARREAAERAIREAAGLQTKGRAEDALKVLRAALERDGKNQELRAALESAQTEITRQREEQKRQEKEKARQEKLAREQAQAEARKAEADKAAAARKAEAEKAAAARKAEADRAAAAREAAAFEAATAVKQKPAAPAAPARTQRQAEQATGSAASRNRLIGIGIAAAVVILAIIGFFVLRSGPTANGAVLVTFTTNPAEARLTVDGNVTACPGTCALKLTAGDHAVALQQDGYTPYSSTVTVDGSAKGGQTVPLTLTPVAAAASNPVAPVQPEAQPADQGSRPQPVTPTQPQATRNSAPNPPKAVPTPSVKQPPVQAPPPTPLPAPAPAADVTAWNAIKDTRDVNSLREFRSHFPSSIYARQAYEKMDELSWGSVREPAQQEELQTYLREFPDGHHAAQARDRVKELQAKAAADQQAQQLAAQQQATQLAQQKQSTQHDHDQILQTLEAYRSAYEGKNLNALAALWVDVPRQKLEKSFKVADKIRVTLTPGTVTINGDAATVASRQRIEITVASAKSVNEAAVLFTLKKQGTKWVIETAK